jgi:hypothetical protein
MLGWHIYRQNGRNYWARLSSPTKLHVVTTHHITVYKNEDIRSFTRQARGEQILAARSP